jgi:UDP-N-acetylmuramate--alanine ligase
MPKGSSRDFRPSAASSGALRTGTWNGVQVFDDYGHHPVEIKAVLHAARESARGQVIAIMQPHRYTRLHDLFDDFAACFNDADAVLIAPVYPAGEQPIEGVAPTELVSRMKARRSPRRAY